MMVENMANFVIVIAEKHQLAIHCKCDWTDTGAKQGFSQLIAFIVHHIVELCRENIGRIPYWSSLFKKQGLSQSQQ